MSAQLWALLAVGGIVIAVASLERWWAARSHRLALGAQSLSRGEPYILYFTGETCSICRTHQEPALARLEGVRIDKVDAVAERVLADRFHVYTLPTTVVLSHEGKALHVNYGYAAVGKLERQIAEARKSALAVASA